jgi:small conductance mechanosensitive channel
VDKIYRIVLILFGLVMAASQVGINVAAALAGLGVAGLAIGFAAQDLLSNVIAGFVIFLDKPFDVGDFIRVQEQYGSVTNVTLRSTRIRTRQNTYVVIPNKHIIDAVVVNHSKHGETRIDVPVGIAYKENIPDARKVILGAVSGLKDVIDNPSPSVVVDELGGSSVNLLVRVWIKDAEREKPVFYSVLEASKLALDAADIQIPYPHLQLFWDDVEDRVIKKFATVPKLVAGDETAGS